jgi:hypothetical protein
LKPTPARYRMLRHAAGLSPHGASASVWRPMEKAGWIVWTVHRSQRYATQKERGWELTAKGREILARLDA